MHNAELAYFREKIESDYKDLLASGSGLPEGRIEEIVAKVNFPTLDEAATASIVRELQAYFKETQRQGAIISTGHRPWLTKQKSEIPFFYWNRLNQYYRKKGILPSAVIATLDADTDEILDRCGNPLDPSDGAVRGMVMGNVQMGKTTNYSALICKAADAGYKVIILLAGITNSLRAQTQQRLDEAFIGKKSVANAAAAELLPIIRYATERRIPAIGTTRESDFKAGHDGIFFGLRDHSEPMLFVTKKNKSVLERLERWIEGQDQTDGFGDLPLLLIDDEADNASINTSKQPHMTTAINRVIRRILSRFPRSAYVGYTATPFANIFIDPETPDDMEHHDLFPSNFIKALEPPSNYVGSHRLFRENGDLKDEVVKVVGDYATFLPIKHKSGHQVRGLPETLKHAVRVFCLTRAIRVLQGKGSSHCSMMINVSRFNAIQSQVMGHVYEYLSELKNAVSVYGGLSPRQIQDPQIEALRMSFETEYAGLDFDWPEVLASLNEGTQSIEVRTVNMQGGQLDYSLHEEYGLHVIAIGGLALSRGLTLEGLTVSYLLRNVAASDTLMQMARWFGYRPGYEKICRLYLPQSSVEHYEYVDEATEELRREVIRMMAANRTPADFGLKVRQSELAIRVTAANKMQTAEKLSVAQNYSAKHIEGHALPNDKNIADKNFAAVTDFLEGLGKPYEIDLGYVRWQAKGKDVIKLIRNFTFGAHLDLAKISDTSLFHDYVQDRLTDEMAEWDIAIPMKKSGSSTQFAGQNVRVRSRHEGRVRDGTYRVFGARSRVADQPDAWIGLNDAQREDAMQLVETGAYKKERAACSVRERPMMLVHVFRPKLSEENSDQKWSDDKLHFSDPAVTLSFCMPETEKPAKAHTYQVNAVYRTQLELQYEQEEEDDSDAIIGNQDD